jgi:putative glutamine amidotransferase
MTRPRIAIPIPTSTDPEYNDQGWKQYASAVERSGGEAVAVSLNDPPAATARLIAGCQGVLLPGSGADVNPQKYGQEPTPECAPTDQLRENVDELLLQDAHNMGKPSLIQHLTRTAVNHKAGRTVPVAHTAAIAPNSLLSQMVIDEEAGHHLLLPVNSSHHQAIATPGDGLRITAHTPEDEVVEAIENAPDGVGGRFVLGVQWHPERSFDASETSRAIFQRFIAEAKAWNPLPPSTPRN